MDAFSFGMSLTERPAWLRWVRQPQNLAWLLLALTACEGIAALVGLLQIPSDPSNQLVATFSAERIATAVATIVPVVLIVIVMIWAILYVSQWRSGIETALEWISDRDRHQAVMIPLAMSLLTGVIAVGVFRSPLADYFGPMAAVYQRGEGLILWGILAAAQAFGWIAVTVGLWPRAAPLLSGTNLRFLVLTLCLYAMLFHWAMLVFQDAVLSNLPYWWPQFVDKPFRPAHLLVIPLTGVFIWLGSRQVGEQAELGRSIVVLTIAAYGLQLGFVAAEGRGLEPLAESLEGSTQIRYVINASPGMSFANSIRYYDERYSQDPLMATKPPGTFLLFLAFERFVKFTQWPGIRESASRAMLNAAAVILPTLASLAPAFTAKLSDLTEAAKPDVLSGWLLVTAPAFLLIQLQADQYLYPVVFSGGLMLFAWLWARPNALAGFMVGLYLYLSIFLSFSLLPLAAVGFLWGGLIFAVGDRQGSSGSWISSVLGAIAGLVVSTAAFWFAYGYDPLRRYQAAIDHHVQVKLFEPGPGQVLRALVVNNLEFLLWMGVPLLILALFRVLKAFHRLIRRIPTRSDLLAAAAATSYLALNLFGQTRGEVGRIWMFWLPLAALFAWEELSVLYGTSKWAVRLLMMGQLGTAVLIFRYQQFF